MLRFLCLTLGVIQLAFAQPIPNQQVDFSTILGIHTGTLTYLDYTSNKSETLSMVGLAYLKGEKLILEHTFYEWGRVIDQKYTYDIVNGQLALGKKAKTISLESDTAAKTFRQVITLPGKDGNEQKPCIFRMTFDYDGKVFAIKKEVSFDNEQSFFRRNEYRMEVIGQS